MFQKHVYFLFRSSQSHPFSRPVTLHAVMDGSQYAMAAESGRTSLAATLGRPNEEGQRSSQVQLRLGQAGGGFNEHERYVFGHVSDLASCCFLFFFFFDF